METCAVGMARVGADPRAHRSPRRGSSTRIATPGADCLECSARTAWARAPFTPRGEGGVAYSCACWPPDCDADGPPFWITTMSTRRFLALSASFLFGATGSY